jgi:predicted DsbA family dithiol-disulfide isomerase
VARRRLKETVMDEKTKITVDVISDVACPWCFIGMKRLERALAQTPEIDVAVRWRPYQLDPTIPPGGVPRKSYMLQKFGSEDKLRQIHDRLVPLGEVEGIRFDFEGMKVSANTLDAHRLIRWAASDKAPDGAQGQVVRRLFEINFEEGGDIGDRAVLAEIAGEAGMDAALIDPLLASNADVEAVQSEIATAGRMGVSGVPCFLLEGKYAVMGAQESETLADAIRQVAAAKARGELEEGGEE